MSRRSSRKKEEKSYCDDLLIDDLLKGKDGSGSPGHGPGITGHYNGHSSHMKNQVNNAMSNSVISNGDVDMDSDDSDDGAPLPDLPLPKVGHYYTAQLYILINIFSLSNHIVAGFLNFKTCC